MKKINAMVLIGLGLALFGVSGRAEFELSLGGSYIQPQNRDNFKTGVGGELQLRAWITDTVGVLVAGGASSWETRSEREIQQIGGVIQGNEISGNATLIPVGASLIFRDGPGGASAVTLELGIRQVLAESEVDITIASIDSAGAVRLRESRLDIDDSIVALAEAQVAVKFGGASSVFLGVGYQWDIVQGDVTFEGQKIGENEWEALFFRAGLLVSF